MSWWILAAIITSETNVIIMLEQRPSQVLEDAFTIVSGFWVTTYLNYLLQFPSSFSFVSDFSHLKHFTIPLSSSTSSLFIHQFTAKATFFCAPTTWNHRTIWTRLRIKHFSSCYKHSPSDIFFPHCYSHTFDIPVSLLLCYRSFLLLDLTCAKYCALS